jgi:hypothetical protein
MTIGLALALIAVGIVLALTFVGLLHALGVACVVVGVLALIFIAVGIWRPRRVR